MQHADESRARHARGEPCDRDLMTVVEHELQRSEPDQGHHRIIPVLDPANGCTSQTQKLIIMRRSETVQYCHYFVTCCIQFYCSVPLSLFILCVYF